MSSYKYDYLLSDQFEKVANALAANVVRAGAPHVARTFGEAAKQVGPLGTIGRVAKGFLGVGRPGRGAERTLYRAGAQANQHMNTAQNALGAVDTFRNIHDSFRSGPNLTNPPRSQF
jgi:hypothetical protein